MLHQGVGTQRPQFVNLKGPDNPGVVAPLAACRMSRQLLVMRGRVFSVEVDGHRLRTCRAPQLMTYMASGSKYMSEQCVQGADCSPKYNRWHCHHLRFPSPVVGCGRHCANPNLWLHWRGLCADTEQEMLRPISWFACSSTFLFIFTFFYISFLVVAAASAEDSTCVPPCHKMGSQTLLPPSDPDNVILKNTHERATRAAPCVSGGTCYSRLRTKSPTPAAGPTGSTRQGW